MDHHDCKRCIICINLYWASQLTCHQRWSSKWDARLSFSNFHVVGVCWDCQAPLPLCLTLCLSIVTSLVGSFQALCVCVFVYQVFLTDGLGPFLLNFLAGWSPFDAVQKKHRNKVTGDVETGFMKTILSMAPYQPQFKHHFMWSGFQSKKGKLLCE